jgi:diaminohydroxyphosphoribosylaminopyrimidine deaminase/5-amino-6-(5-phosphoribosylamino)uracil reductase
MSLSGIDEIHLQRALHLAEDAAALASPNPTVGCVLALGDRVLGEGAHLYDCFDHAEIVALKQAAALGHNVRGATAYVTLEPCAHHGRTPPCSNALIAAGIARCVIATVDPNPLVRGAGIAKLRAAGIEVTIADPASPIAQQTRTLNDAFAFSIQHGRPFVTLKAAVSLDGMLAPPRGTRSVREPVWLTGPAARADVQQLRHTSDAILTGIGTVLADNPGLTDRTGLPRRRPLLRVILDPDLRLPHDSAIATTASNDVLIVCSANAFADRASALRAAGIEIIHLPDEPRKLDLDEVLTALASRKILSVLLEAGPTLNTAFLNNSLADKLVLYTAPTTLGPNALPFATGIASPRDLEPQLTHITRVTFPHGDAEDLRLTGYLHNPWTGVEISSI